MKTKSRQQWPPRVRPRAFYHIGGSMDDLPGQREEYIGVVGVDSGRLMLCDPAYVDVSSELRDIPERYLPDLGQIPYEDGRSGAGVIFQTGVGDGLYDVYAVYDEGGVFALRIEVQPLEGTPWLRLVKSSRGDGDDAA